MMVISKNVFHEKIAQFKAVLELIQTLKWEL
jgi:hypothetical protein